MWKWTWKWTLLGSTNWWVRCEIDMSGDTSSTSKQIRGFAYLDKHYAVLMLKRVCLETGILFMHIANNRIFKWPARKTHLRKRIRGKETISIKPITVYFWWWGNKTNMDCLFRALRAYVFFGLVHCFIVLLGVCLVPQPHTISYSPGPIQNILHIFLWHDIACLCWKCRYTPINQPTVITKTPMLTTYLVFLLLVRMIYLPKAHKDSKTSCCEF